MRERKRKRDRDTYTNFERRRVGDKETTKDNKIFIDYLKEIETETDGQIDRG